MLSSTETKMHLFKQHYFHSVLDYNINCCFCKVYQSIGSSRSDNGLKWLITAFPASLFDSSITISFSMLFLYLPINKFTARILSTCGRFAELNKNKVSSSTEIYTKVL